MDRTRKYDFLKKDKIHPEFLVILLVQIPYYRIFYLTSSFVCLLMLHDILILFPSLLRSLVLMNAGFDRIK